MSVGFKGRGEGDIDLKRYYALRQLLHLNNLEKAKLLQPRTDASARVFNYRKLLIGNDALNRIWLGLVLKEKLLQKCILLCGEQGGARYQRQRVCMYARSTVKGNPAI